MGIVSKIENGIGSPNFCRVKEELKESQTLVVFDFKVRSERLNEVVRF